MHNVVERRTLRTGNVVTFVIQVLELHRRASKGVMRGKLGFAALLSFTGNILRASERARERSEGKITL